MDPDEILKEIRELASKGWSADWDDAMKLMERFQDLDDWLTKGGFLPEPWAEGQRIARERLLR